MGKIVNGQRFGLLLAVEATDQRANGAIVWKCLCDCGNEAFVRASKLKNSYTRSCGCLQRETTVKTFTKHGECYSRTYTTWLNMRNRCNNPNNDAYENYGGRGIAVCSEWDDFEKFLSDMGERPKGMSIERIDNNQGYFKENCRWATSKEQHSNKRNNHTISFKGEDMTITQLAEKVGVKRSTLYYRLKNGWSIEKAISI